MSEANQNQDPSSNKVNRPFVKANFPVEYKHWKNMRRKCYSKSYKGFHLYGGRGIKVSDRWWDFSKFMEDVSVRPTRRHSIALQPGAKEFGPATAAWMTPEEASRFGPAGTQGPDDSKLESPAGRVGPSGPSSPEDFSPKRVSYIHCFIDLLCPKCGGKLWVHPGTIPDGDGFSMVNCFECDKPFRWKRTDTLISE